MRCRGSVLSIAACCRIAGAVFAAGAANAADIYTKAPLADAIAAPAVDGINGKIDGFGGSLAKRSFYGSEGVFSVPLGFRYGLQVDGAVGTFGGSGFASTAGHMFWRDPSVGLVGAYTSYTHWNRFSGVNLAKYGAEGAWYAGRWTFEGAAGVENGTRKTDISGGFTTTINLATRGFDHITASYYVTDNFKLSIGHLFTGGQNALSLGTEYGIGLGGGRMGSLFAEGRIGEAGKNGIFGGLKVYFGQHEKSLIRRNREDDPTPETANGLQGIGNATNSAPTAPTCLPPKQIIGGVCDIFE